MKPVFQVCASIIVLKLEKRGPRSLKVILSYASYAESLKGSGGIVFVSA